ncbi:MAG: peptidase M4 family protein [Ideonella sp. MAG2]|nr:MAG: peptidase M4 family protein [Ideonella sp. MAG2]
MTHRFPLRPLLVAALALCSSAASLAAVPQADHPAVQRALGHLQAENARTLAGTGHDFLARDLILDPDGSEHVRFARRYQGLPVIGGDVVVHSRAAGTLRQLSQTLRAAPSLSTTASLGEARAIALATAAFQGQPEGSARSQLAVYARGLKPRLAYDVTISGVLSNGGPSRSHLIIDAHTGRLLDRWDDLHSAAAVGTGQSHYSGSVSLNTESLASGGFALRDTTRGRHEVHDLKGKNAIDKTPKSKVMKDSDNVWGDGVQGTTSQSDGVDAAYGFANTWDFYKTRFGRNGIADDGRGGLSRVHASNLRGFFYNAWWDGDCFCMTYTNLHPSGYGALVSLDIAGHEMTHGVTENTAGLIYSDESGGLNEATSDIMGAMVERFANNANDPADYLIGENPLTGSYIRNMVQPSTDSRSADCYYSGVGSLDVHLSSGVANHMFYILAEGSRPAGGPASPTCQATDTRVATGSATVAGIGHLDATAIYYRALTVYMTSSTNFAQARVAMVDASTDLFGASSAQTQAVKAAWSAVNVN